MCAVTPDDRHNVRSLIRSDDVLQKIAACCELRGFEVVVGPLFEGLQGGYVRGARKSTIVCRCRVNVWSVKGERLLGREHAHGGVDAPDPVARRRKMRCLGKSER